MLEFIGNFKGQKDSTSNWLAIPSSEVPEPRPGKCVDNSRELPMQTVNFVNTHALMETAVPALYGRPLLTRVTSRHRFTTVTVDAQVEALSGDRYDVLFVGTDNGRIIKFINYLSAAPAINDSGSNPNVEQKPPTLETVVITETQALPHNLPVKQMTVARDQNSVIVVGNGHVVSIPLNHCSHIALCRDCLNLQDPYCVWDTQNHECTSIASLTTNNRKNFIQNIRQRKNSSSTIEMCKQSGDDKDNWNNDVNVPQLATKVEATDTIGGRRGSSDADNSKGNGATQSNIGSTRGTVSSIGRTAPSYSANEINPKTVNSIGNGKFGFNFSVLVSFPNPPDSVSSAFQAITD